LVPTVLIELLDGEGVVRRDDGEIVVTQDVSADRGQPLRDGDHYQPVKTSLHDDRCLVGGLLPSGAVSAEVIDDRGTRVAAKIGGGAYAAILKQPNDGHEPVVCCRDATGTPVRRPLPDVAQLNSRGFVWIRSAFPRSEDAFDAAHALVDACWQANALAELAVIGDFVVPPINGRQTREFQTLHFDFGLPLDPKLDQDIARYTALYIPRGVRSVSAVTRLVPLTGLLSQRTWPPFAELLGGLIAYGRTHGAWDDARGYVEGSLARVVEGAAASSPCLPSVKSDPGFLCGTEFDSLRSEVAFFEQHGLRVKEAEVELDLQPGELLVFDNLAVAHGRRGTREPGELRQRVYGHRRLSRAAQCELRDRVLSAFGTLSRRRDDF
jgi:Taurine catabolism dioxygenase TauD, TfdA family